MSAPVVRVATRSDLDSIADLLQALATQGQGADARFRPVANVREVLRSEARDRWFGRFLPFPCCWVAEQRGTIVGMVGGAPMAVHPGYQIDATARLEHLYVVSEARRRGIGRQLVKAFEQAADAAGYPRLEVSTLAADGQAVAFWRALGFGPWMVTLAR